MRCDKNPIHAHQVAPTAAAPPDLFAARLIEQLREENGKLREEVLRVAGWDHRPRFCFQ